VPFGDSSRFYCRGAMAHDRRWRCPHMGRRHSGLLGGKNLGRSGAVSANATNTESGDAVSLHGIQGNVPGAPLLGRMRDLHRDGSQDALIGPGAAVGLVGAEFSERAEEARKLGPKLRGIVTPPPVANRDRVIQFWGVEALINHGNFCAPMRPSYDPSDTKVSDTGSLLKRSPPNVIGP
jgi:hypothetical protein